MCDRKTFKKQDKTSLVMYIEAVKERPAGLHLFSAFSHL